MSQWLSCLPSLGEAECSLILQSKSLALEVTQMGRAPTLVGRAPNIQSKSLALDPAIQSKALAPEVIQSVRAPRMPQQDVRKIQEHARRVSRAFTELCRSSQFALV